MAIAVEMPKMSDTMEEGVLAAWLVEEGTSISAGDVVAQVETDKATMDLEVYDDGVLLKRVIGEGDAVPIGGLIAILGQEGEDISDILAKYGGGGNSAPPAAEEAAPVPAPAPAPVASGPRAGRSSTRTGRSSTRTGRSRRTRESIALGSENGQRARYESSRNCWLRSGRSHY